MTPPKKIHLLLNNVPPCNFGALWYEDEVPGGVAYVLESDVQQELAQKDATIRFLDSRLAEFEEATGHRFAELDKRLVMCERARHYE